MILGIDHIGVATDDPGAVGAAMAALGMRMADGGVAESYGVSCEFWQYPADPAQDPKKDPAQRPAVELVAPVRGDSAVTGHLARKGPGLYHIAFEVDDVELELARLRSNGFVPVDREPCAGARPGMRVAFMYVRKPAGLLIELVQYSLDHI